MARITSHLHTVLSGWLPIALTLTLVSGLIYGVAQQILRQSANDPQVQIAQDAAAYIESGHPISSVSSFPQIDISKSLALYVMVFDDKSSLLASSALLHGKAPVLPVGVLDYTREHIEHRLTWQPAPGVRSAVVLVRYSTDKVHGFVLVGRSLRETEQRISDLLWKVVLGWAVSLGVTFAASYILNKK